LILTTQNSPTTSTQPIYLLYICCTIYITITTSGLLSSTPPEKISLTVVFSCYKIFSSSPIVVAALSSIYYRPIHWCYCWIRY